MLFFHTWLRPEVIDSLTVKLTRGDSVDFGYCPRDKAFTPAVFGFSGTAKEYMKCGFCELSSYVHPAQHYPGYTVRAEMRGRRVEKFISLGLDTIEGQKNWLIERVNSQHGETKQEICRLRARAQELADENKSFKKALRTLQKIN